MFVLRSDVQLHDRQYMKCHTFELRIKFTWNHFQRKIIAYKEETSLRKKSFCVVSKHSITRVVVKNGIFEVFGRVN